MEISFYRTEKYAEFFYIHILIKTKKKKALMYRFFFLIFK